MEEIDRYDDPEEIEKVIKAVNPDKNEAVRANWREKARKVGITVLSEEIAGEVRIRPSNLYSFDHEGPEPPDMAA